MSNRGVIARYFSSAFAVAGALAACAGDSDSEATNNEALAIPVEQAQDLLKAQLTGDVEITTVSAEQVTWPNGAMGCPKPGMMYTQALVDGYRIVLLADGREYAYHGRMNGKPFYCADVADAK